MLGCSEIKITPVIDDEKKEVALTYFAIPGDKVYVRRINFNGVDEVDDALGIFERVGDEVGLASFEDVVKGAASATAKKPVVKRRKRTPAKKGAKPVATAPKKKKKKKKKKTKKKKPKKTIAEAETEAADDAAGEQKDESSPSTE